MSDDEDTLRIKQLEHALDDAMEDEAEAASRVASIEQELLDLRPDEGGHGGDGFLPTITATRLELP